MDLTEAIADLNNFGIDLKLEEYEDEVFYASAIKEWFILNCEYEVYTIDEREFGVELEGENIATIYIQNSVLAIRIHMVFFWTFLSLSPSVTKRQ